MEVVAVIPVHEVGTQNLNRPDRRLEAGLFVDQESNPDAAHRPPNVIRRLVIVISEDRDTAIRDRGEWFERTVETAR